MPRPHCLRLRLARLGLAGFLLSFASLLPAAAPQQDSTATLSRSLEIPNPPIETHSTVVDWPFPEVRREVPELKKLDASTSQDELPAILGRVGERVAALFRDFPNTTSREDVNEEKLFPEGTVETSISQDFHYLVLAGSEAGRPIFREYRTNAKGRLVTPSGLNQGFVLTAGFASMAIHFHPQYQGQSRFRYLGTEMMDKHETDVVAFAQKPAAQEKGVLVISGRRAVVLYQGVAWIDHSNDKIVRMRTDLERPALEIGLKRQTTRVKFGEVHFKGESVVVWLPREVVVEAEFTGQTFRNIHRYSDFKLFSVETEQKSPEPN
ncbi:MAG TPA: hypothetical protein VGW33_06990 [Terriglobia bacterium]|nr:hypothetical protein [Terriglobia bacterium]